jgi:hypothetical protein
VADDFFDFPPLRDDAAAPGTKDYAIVEWAENRLKIGQKFVESSVGYDRISKAIDAIFSHERESTVSYIPGPKSLSRTKANLVAKTAEDLTALLTDTRVFWNYATRNPKYERQARLSNKDAEDWYTSRCIDLRIADAVRYYTVAGTCFVHLYYSRRINDMMVEAEDPRSVFPIDPISYHTCQDAKGMIVRKARTPDWVREEFHKEVKADIGEPGIFGWFTRTFGAGAKRHFGPLSKQHGDDEGIPGSPTVFVNTMYLKDSRLNKALKPVYMGQWGKNDQGPVPETRWSYIVKPGQPLYPFGRMIVWGGGALLYDGPSPYWHGMFPLIKLTLNPWPKSWLGKAPLWDVMPLVDSLNALLRIIDDHAAQLAQPGVVADRNVSRAELNKFNSRAAGWQIKTNLSSGKGIQVVYPNPLDASLWAHIKWIQEMIQQLSGTADISQIARLNQLPSDDTIETLMKAMTPGVRLRSRILEGFMKEFAEMYLYCIAEFDSLSKRIAKFGPSAVTPEDSDFNPRSFIPDDIPDGDLGDIASSESALGIDSPRPEYQRAREMFKSFQFSFKPGSLLNSAAVQDRMEDLMLSKMGYLSVFTLMENLGKMNFAPPSVIVPSSELERLKMQQDLGIGMIANAQGRKATGQAPPQLSNSGGGDVTLQTS